MTEPNDVLAVFRCAFDDLHGQLLDPASRITAAFDGPELSLAGIEFAALPSGLHAVSTDSFHFDWHGALAICRFTSSASAAGSNARGRAMATVGVLVRRTDDGRAFRHASVLEQAAAGDGWDWARLGAWFEREQVRGPAPAKEGRGRSGDRAGRLAQLFPFEDIPSHPLLALERLPPAVLVPLSKLACSPRARILFLTRPPLRPTADWAWSTAVLSRSLCAANGPALRALGVVGLGDMDKLGRLRTGGEGWVAVTSDAIFKERPQLYDLLVELYPSAPRPTYSSATLADTAPEPAPVPKLTFSTATADPKRPRRAGVRLSLWDRPLAARLAAGGRSSGDESESKTWLGSLWDGCGWCLGLLLGRSGAGDHGAGAIYLPLSGEDVAGEIDDDVDGDDDEGDDDAPDALEPALSLVRALRQHYAHLSHHLLALVPPPALADDEGAANDPDGPPAPARLLSAADLVRLGLSPLGLPCDRVLVEGLSGGRVRVGTRWI